DGRRGERAGGGEVVLLLEFLDRFSKRLVVGGAAVARDVKTLTQRRRPVVLHADLEYGAFADRRFLLIDLAGADIGEFGLERAIAGSLRLVGIERGDHVAGAGNGGKNVTWLRSRRRKFDVRADARPVYASDAGVMGVSDDRGGQLNFRLGQISRRAQRREIRDRIVGWIKPVAVDMAEIIDRRRGARIDLAI